MSSPTDEPELFVARVRSGELLDQGSWVYAWIRADGNRGVVYVGATGMHPATRAWLHLHDANPDVGRIAARCPEAGSEPLDVLALRLPVDTSRQDVKHAVIARLADRQLLGDRYVGDPPATPPDASPATAAHADRLVAQVAAYLRSTSSSLS